MPHWVLRVSPCLLRNSSKKPLFFDVLKVSFRYLLVEDKQGSSVVQWFRRFYHHGGTENTENALRQSQMRTLLVMRLIYFTQVFQAAPLRQQNRRRSDGRSYPATPLLFPAAASAQSLRRGDAS